MHAALRYALYGLFAVSGFCGLIYESIWSHYLRNYLGHAAHGQTVVLVIFVGGLALGAWLAGRYTERMREPLLAYAAAEIFIGLFAFVFHPVFVGFTGWAYDTLLPAVCGASGWCATQWITAALLIAAPAIALGRHVSLDGRRRAATLSASARARDQRALLPQQPRRRVRRARERVPVHSRARPAGHGDAGRRVERRHRHRCLRHCMVDACAAQRRSTPPKSCPKSPAAVRGKSAKRAAATAPASAAAAPPLPRRASGSAKSLVVTFLAVAALTGLSSFIYEIVWIRMLVLVLGASTHAFELMLAAFILGLAAGGAWIRNRIDRIADARSFLGHVQVLDGRRRDS